MYTYRLFCFVSSLSIVFTRFECDEIWPLPLPLERDQRAYFPAKYEPPQIPTRVSQILDTDYFPLKHSVK